MLNVLRYVPGLDDYKPIDACFVAQAMINACFTANERVRTYTLKEVFRLAGET